MIRKSSIADIDKIMSVFEKAKAFMRQNGNHSQWTNGYPSTNVIINDIANGNHYVGLNESDEIIFTFTFIVGPDPTYEIIEDGKWLNDKPYGTIHRIASSGASKGVLRESLNYCQNIIKNIRIDTHVNNAPMLNALEKLHFTRCGIIHISDGSPRIAFQKQL